MQVIKDGTSKISKNKCFSGKALLKPKLITEFI